MNIDLLDVRIKTHKCTRTHTHTETNKDIHTHTHTVFAQITVWIEFKGPLDKHEYVYDCVRLKECRPSSFLRVFLNVLRQALFPAGPVTE